MPLVLAAVTVFGLVLGRGLARLTPRLPHRQCLSFVRRCSECGEEYPFWQPLPLVGPLLQGGGCKCARPELRRDALIEAAAVILAVLVYLRLGPTAAAVYVGGLLLVLAALTITDLEHHLLPNHVTGAAAVLWLALRLAGLGPDWISAGIGAGAAGLFFLVLAVAGRGAMGGGDVKLAAVLGLYMGWPQIVTALFLAFFAAAAVGLILILLKKKTRKDWIPFGPFLAFGSAAVLLWLGAPGGWTGPTWPF